jgi:hypothetical protein
MTPSGVSAFRRTVSRIGLPLLASLVATTRVQTDDPVSSSVRYTGEIVRIFDRKCAPCHGAGSLAMPLSTYRDVRDWGRAIREEIVDQRMPPWSAARGYARIRNELALTARETTTILSWLDGGMPRGDDRNLPMPPPADPDPPPDLRLALPPQRVPALDEHVVRRVTIATELTVPRDVSRVQFTPGRRGLLRAALVFLDRGDGSTQWIGAWLPWQPRLPPPASPTFRLPPGARIAVELHYRGGDQDVDDLPGLDIYFAEQPSLSAGSAVGELLIDATAPVRLTAAAAVWAIVPSADATASSLELIVRRPDGAIDVLMWIPEFRREWPQALVLQDVVRLPAGTTVTLAAEPRSSTASARLSLLSAMAASRATRSPTRTPALRRR